MGKKPGRELTDRQAMFVREYLIDLNATQAAIRAGYCKKNKDNADKVGPDLMKNSAVAKAIQNAMSARATRVEVKSDDVLRELAQIAFCDIGEAYAEDGRLLPIKDIPVNVRKAMAGVKVYEDFLEGDKVGETVEAKFWNKNQALEVLGKHLKLFAGDAPVINNYQNLTDEELTRKMNEIIKGIKNEKTKTRNR